MPHLNRVSGAGTLSFQAHGLNVTLTDYFWALPGVAGVSNLDRVAALNNTTNGNIDFDGQFTLTVAVPEPATLALYGFSLAWVGFMGWWRRKAG